MKKLSLSIIIVCVVGFFGCSKLKNENPATPTLSVDVHQDGWAAPASPNFHGIAIAAQNGDTKSCTKCHGTDYNGGTSETSCNGCHKSNHSAGVASPSAANFHGKIIAARNGDMTKCKLCHGTDFNGGMSGKSCTACHTHPTGITTPSSANFHGKVIAANNWSMSSCTKCHGSNYAGGPLATTCLTCHTKPNGPENCTTCHGDATKAATNAATFVAPPADLAGNTASSARGVGMHQIHLVGGGTLSATKLQCTNCHVVPSTFASPGHIDATQQYAQVRFDSTGTIAFTKTNAVGTAGSAPYAPSLPTFVPNPSYSSATIKCSNTYCHGNFKNGNPTNAPAWNDASGNGDACGTCHGDVTKTALADRALPKTALNGGTHFPVNTCSGCHADVVDANLKIINTAKHMNGKLNVFGQETAF